MGRINVTVSIFAGAQAPNDLVAQQARRSYKQRPARLAVAVSDATSSLGGLRQP